jgi:hypothetical protein
MNNPDAVPAFDLNSDARVGAWDNNVGTFATEGRRLA